VTTRARPVASHATGAGPAVPSPRGPYSPGRSLAVAALGAFVLAYGCSPRGAPAPGASSGPGTSATASPTTAPARVTYTGVDRYWPGRDAYRVCVEDLSGVFGDAAARDRLAASIESLVSSANPGLPAQLDAGCPFDYPSRPVIARTDPSVYSLQIYVRADIPEPATEVLEHWLQPGRGRCDTLDDWAHASRTASGEGPRRPPRCARAVHRP
jgi:hypothetical protein